MVRRISMIFALSLVSSPAVAQLHDLPPKPAGNPVEHPRRPGEVAFDTAGTAPVCNESIGNPEACRTTEPGAGFSLTGLWRPGPRFAFGPAGSVSILGTGGPFHGGSTTAVDLGVVGRAYFVETGKLDPWFQLGAGRSWVFAEAKNDTGALVGLGRRSAWSATAAAGLDISVLPHLKIGPTVTYARYYGARLDSCAIGRCEQTGLGRLDQRLAVGFSTTISLGRPM